MDSNQFGEMRFDFAHDGRQFVGMTIAGMAAAAVGDAVVLDVVKARLAQEVDAQAEALRSTIVTPGAGQAMEYQETQAQAFAVLAAAAAGKPVAPDAYPMLKATIGLDRDPSTGAPAADVLGVARAVQDSYDAWLAIGAAIKAARMNGKAAVRAAVTPDAAREAFGAIAWPALS